MKKEKIETEFASAISDLKNRGLKVENCGVSTTVTIIIVGVLTWIPIRIFSPLWSGKYYLDILIILFTILITILIHQLFHAIGFTIKRFEKWKGNIKFGFWKNKMVLCCNYSKPVLFVDYLFGLVLPFTVLSLCLVIIGIITGVKILLFISIVNALLSLDDLTVTLMLLKKHPFGVLDHPTNTGFIAVYK